MTDPIIAWGLGTVPPTKATTKPAKVLAPVDQRIRERRYRAREPLGVRGLIKLVALAQRMYGPGKAFNPADEEFMGAVRVAIRPGVEVGVVCYLMRRHALHAVDPAFVYDHSTKLFMLNPDWRVFGDAT